MIGHDLLFSAWTDRGLVYIKLFFIHIQLYILNFIVNRQTKTMTNDRTDLLSVGAPDVDKTVTV
jgi:hypothetical protein